MGPAAFFFDNQSGPALNQNMKISTLLLAVLGLLLPVGAFAQAVYDFEQDGLYYKINDEGMLNVVKPTSDFVYSGSVTLPSKVTHDGVTYEVNLNTGSVFDASKITEFTMGEGWGAFKTLHAVSLRNTDIERVTLMAPGEVAPLAYPDQLSNGHLRLDQSRKIAQAEVTFDGEEYTLRVWDVNVFDGDGNRLPPFIGLTKGAQAPVVSEENGKKIYSFNLGANIATHYEDYGGVLPLSEYNLVFLYFRVDEGNFLIRFRIPTYKTGDYHMADGIRYAVVGDELAVIPLEEGIYTGEVEIPQSLNIRGRDLPVTQIAEAAFENSDIETVTLPLTIEEIQSNAFRDCHKLVKSDLSACFLKDIGGSAFAGCENLKEVVMPAEMPGINQYRESWFRSFLGCASLESINLPKWGYFNYTFSDCLWLLGFKSLEATDDELRFTLNPQIFKNDGITRIRIVSNTDKVRETTGVDGTTVYSVAKEDITSPSGMLIGFRPENNDGYFIDDSQPLFEITVSLNDQSGLSGSLITEDAPVEYFNLQGVRVEEPSAGLYIRRQGPKAEKVLLR